MSALHAYFHRRDQQAFQRAIDSSVRALSANGEGKPSSSLGRSLSNSPHAALGSSYLDVNARDGLGRTVLHLACASTHPSAPTYVRLLLAHPHIQANAHDGESRWTPLHRALYHGNLAAALLLLQRSDVDVYAKDWEGYTAYDVWNSSIEGTKPQRTPREGDDADGGALEAEMYAWGSNRNAALGVGDGDDRAFPDLVHFDRDRDTGNDRSVDDKFGVVRVGAVSMARFHTAIVTTDPRANVRVCGFGSAGRLGPGIHTTTYTPTPLTGLPASGSVHPQSQSCHSPSTSHSLPHPRADRQIVSGGDPHRIVAVAAGQDHTLALTAGGDVWSWGSNRHAVLGYTIDDAVDASERKPAAEKHDARKGEKEASAVQTAPRKVQGGLKGKRVRVVAACRTASAAVTAEGEVLTWGVNGGQLGYDRAAHPVQTLPRVVTKVSQPVVDATITDTATVLLLASHDALCLHGNTSFRLVFPAHAFPAAIAPYRPPQAARNASIRRVVATELPASASAGGRESAMFVALSHGGEVFTWVLGASDAGERERREVVRPQRVWALRKKFSAVRDVALGADGSIVVCTESGHVFLRSRAPAGGADVGDGALLGAAAGVGKAFKFQRVPYLQRVVRVCANSAGAYAALRVDARAEEVRVEGATVAEEIGGIAPWPARTSALEEAKDEDADKPDTPMRERDDEDLHDPAILADQRALRELLVLLSRHTQAKKAGEPALFGNHVPHAHGADMLVHVLGGAEPYIPAHRVILAARSSALRDVLAGQRSIEARVAEGGVIRLALAKEKDKARALTQDGRHPAPWAHPSRLTISGAHALTVLVLLTYLYTDTLLAVWDWRVASSRLLTPLFETLKAKPGAVKAELQALAGALELHELTRALEGAFKREVRGGLAGALGRVCAEVCAAHKPFAPRDPLRPDVVLRLADREVRCHAAVLRARSPLFGAFFDEEVWTANRWTADGCVVVDFGHVGWRAAGFVLRYLYGAEGEMFNVLEDVHSVDELLELMFSVMSAANELLLDRLILLCSRVIQRFVSIPNACAILSEATYYNALPLVRSVQGYMARNLETLLEGHMLDDLPADLIKELSAFVREQQTRKAPLARSSRLVDAAMEKHRAWLESEDFPQPIVRTGVGKPLSVARKRSVGVSPATSPAMRPLSTSKPIAPQPPAQEAADDGVFMMDGVDAIPPLSLSQSAVPKSVSSPSQEQKGAGWKVASTVPKVDMKAIMAEAETTKATTPRTAAPRQPTASDVPNWRTPQRKPIALPADAPRASPGSPWKAIPSVQTVANLASSAGQSPVATPPMTPQMRATRPRDETPSAGPSKSQPSTPQRPGMGPMFSPAKQSPSKPPAAPGMRRVSSGSAAWTLPPVQPVVQSTTTTTGISFVAIQEAQREQAETAPRKDRRSLKQIQEEEQARQVEEDFLRWWTVEEERMRVEQMPAQPAAPAPSPRRPRAKKSAPKAGDGANESGKKEKPSKEGVRREGAHDNVEGSSSAPRRRRRPGPAATPKAGTTVDG